MTFILFASRTVHATAKDTSIRVYVTFMSGYFRVLLCNHFQGETRPVSAFELLTDTTQAAGSWNKSLWCKDILTVVRLNPRELGLPEFVLLHYVTKVANEECVIFVLERKMSK